jgi:iron complex transport system permease protein
MTLSVPRVPLGFSALGLFLALAVLLACATGRYPISPGRLTEIVIQAAFHPFRDPEGADARIFLALRLPRILAAVLVGAALSASGASFQAVFRNPMADPGILGASAGAACGACFGILWGHSFAAIQILSFTGGILAVSATVFLASRVRRDGDGSLPLLLSGIVVSALATALLSMAKTLADTDSKLPAITYWLMGGLSGLEARDARLATLLILPALAGLWLVRARLDALSFGDEEARSLGVEPQRTRLAAVALSTLLVSTAVSLCGVVGWVGILVPHFVRLTLGPRFSRLLPGVVLGGAAFLLLVDTAARSVFPVEIPLGILTALLGAPLFASLLARSSKAWT